jgi:hypothetical protein
MTFIPREAGDKIRIWGYRIIIPDEAFDYLGLWFRYPPDMGVSLTLGLNPPQRVFPSLACLSTVFPHLSTV